MSRHQSKPLIVIGICTRQRNALLRRLLDSIWAQSQPSGYDVAVVIVDNNDAPSLSPSSFQLSDKFSLRVLHEDRPGLVYARNHVLDAATSMGADWVIGVDDDEWVHDDWLAQFIIGIEQLETTIIVAAKHVVYDENLSPYLAPLSMPQETAGAPSKIYSTANYAVHKSIFDPNSGAGMRFDSRFNQSGGEDFELMTRARRLHGVVPKQWPHAIAYEEFFGIRGTFKYRFHRNVLEQIVLYQVAALHRRLGIHGSRLRNFKRFLLQMTRLAVYGTVDCIVGGIQVALRKPSAHERIGTGLLKWARILAIFPYLFGMEKASYGAAVQADRSKI